MRWDYSSNSSLVGSGNGAAGRIDPSPPSPEIHPVPPVLLQSSTAQASALQSQPGEFLVSRESRQKPRRPEFFIWRLHGITDTNSGNAARVRSICESKVESQTPAVASIQHRRPLSNLSSVFHPASQRVPWYQILNQTNTHYLCIHVCILNIYI